MKDQITISNEVDKRNPAICGRMILHQLSGIGSWPQRGGGMADAADLTSVVRVQVESRLVIEFVFPRKMVAHSLEGTACR